MHDAAKYTDRIRVTEKAYWDHQDQCWRNTETREKCASPSLNDLRLATTDDILQRLSGLVPELTMVLNAYRDQTLGAFVKALLDRVQEQMPGEITALGQALIRTVVAQQATEASRSSFAWTIEKKVEELVVGHLRALVAQELEESLGKKPGLIQDAVTAALKSENVHMQVNNLISPKLVKLVEELRLELTAGAGRGRY